MSDEFLGVTDTQQASEPVQVAQSEAVVAEQKTEYSDFLQAITNQEGKPKYKTVADALLGAAKAQEHIQRIEQENAELRAVAKKVETLEQVLTKLDAGKTVDQSTTPKIEDQEKIVLSILEKQRIAEREQANRQTVLKSIQDKFGDKTNEVLTSKAKDLGLSVHELGALAARSPQAVLELFKTETRGTPTVTGTVNTQALQPSSDVKVPENIMFGASSNEVIDFWRQIKADVSKELGL